MVAPRSLFQHHHAQHAIRRRRRLEQAHPDQVPIQWEGNPAHLDSILYEVAKYYKRTGQFQPLLNNRSVLLSNGKTAVENLQAIPFVSGSHSYGATHDFDDPCPPTAKRVELFNDKQQKLATPGATFTNIASIPAGLESSYVVSKATVDKDLSVLLESSSFVIQLSSKAAKLCEKADGCGLTLLELLRAESGKAKAKDRALVRNQLRELIKAE